MIKEQKHNPFLYIIYIGWKDSGFPPYILIYNILINISISKYKINFIRGIEK